MTETGGFTITEERASLSTERLFLDAYLHHVSYSNGRTSRYVSMTEVRQMPTYPILWFKPCSDITPGIDLIGPVGQDEAFRGCNYLGILGKQLCLVDLRISDYRLEQAKKYTNLFLNGDELPQLSKQAIKPLIDYNALNIPSYTTQPKGFANCYEGEIIKFASAHGIPELEPIKKILKANYSDLEQTPDSELNKIAAQCAIFHVTDGETSYKKASQYIPLRMKTGQQIYFGAR